MSRISNSAIVSAVRGVLRMDKLDFKQSLVEMVRSSGLSPYRVSLAINRAKNYVSTLLGSDSKPNVELFARIAAACGFEIIVRGHGKEWQLSSDLGVTFKRLEDFGGSIGRVTQDALELGAVDVVRSGKGYAGVDANDKPIVFYW